jgi:hypothetical protein
MDIIKTHIEDYGDFIINIKSQFLEEDDGIVILITQKITYKNDTKLSSTKVIHREKIMKLNG